MTKGFQKRVENFCCDNCGQLAEGTGYTNHCPACLWSKHVDINPGDRLAECSGLMKPLGLTIHQGKKILIHRCQKCGHKKANETVSGDNAELLIKLSSQPFKLKK